jgi:SAM-dependent methyltransferase
MRPSYYARRVVPRRFQRPLRNAVAEVRAPLLRGSARECPICGGTFRRFVAAPGRSDAICPRCYSAERHRLLWLYLRAETDFFTGPQRVLHVAPENSFEARLRSTANLDYVTGDLEAPADFTLDLTNALFDSESFDVVICLHVLEHIKDDGSAMRELRRIVRPGGLVFVDVPLDERQHTYEPEADNPAERYRLLGQHDHVRFYGRVDLRRRLEEAGFDVTVERGAHMSEEDHRRFGFHGATMHVCQRGADRPDASTINGLLSTATPSNH